MLLWRLKPNPQPNLKRHGAPYRRCGRLFDAEETRIAVAELSEDDINRLNNDPHLLVHFDAAEAE